MPVRTRERSEADQPPNLKNIDVVEANGCFQVR